MQFTAQLVSQISAYLDIILPKYFSCNEFGVPIASEYKFAKKVSRLNLNIIFLCLKNGVSPEDINPTQSLHNLYLLFANTLCKKENPSNTRTAKTKLTEKLYELSVMNASVLERFSPTNDDLMNDSDEGRDEEKPLKVIRFRNWLLVHHIFCNVKLKLMSRIRYYCKCLHLFFKDMDDWEAVSLGVGGGSSDMMIVNLSQLNMPCNSNWAMSTSPSSPVQSPDLYGVGQAASTATSFVSSLIRGFTGATSPTNTSTTIYEPFSSPKK